MRASDTLVIKSRDAFQPLSSASNDRRALVSLNVGKDTKTLHLRSSLQLNIYKLLSVESIGALSSHHQTKFGEFFAPSELTPAYFKLVDQTFDQIP